MPLPPKSGSRSQPVVAQPTRDKGDMPLPPKSGCRRSMQTGDMRDDNVGLDVYGWGEFCYSPNFPYNKTRGSHATPYTSLRSGRWWYRLLHARCWRMSAGKGRPSLRQPAVPSVFLLRWFFIIFIVILFIISTFALLFCAWWRFCTKHIVEIAEY